MYLGCGHIEVIGSFAVTVLTWLQNGMKSQKKGYDTCTRLSQITFLITQRVKLFGRLIGVKVKLFILLVNSIIQV